MTSSEGGFSSCCFYLVQSISLISRYKP